MELTSDNGEDFVTLDIITVHVILGVLLVMIIIVLPIIIYKRVGMIQILLKYYCGHYEDKDDKLYDVYVSFDTEDIRALSFVLGQLRTFLRDSGYSSFIFPLDSLPGSDRSDDTTEAMEQSRRVMLVFGQSYRSCEWCRFEFITARRLFMKHRLRLIPILFGENLSDILRDNDFSSILKCVPFISMPESSAQCLSSETRKKMSVRMPRHARNKSYQMHCEAIV